MCRTIHTGVCCTAFVFVKVGACLVLQVKLLFASKKICLFNRFS